MANNSLQFIPNFKKQSGYRSKAFFTCLLRYIHIILLSDVIISKMKYFLLAFYLVVMVAAKNVRYKVCPDTPASSKVVSVDISPCDAEPCVLHKGQRAGIKITFFSSTSDVHLNTKVTARVGPAWLPYPGVDVNACENHNIKCPLEKSHQYVYTYSLDVKSSFPSIRTVVSWELVGDNGDDVCIEIPVQVA